MLAIVIPYYKLNFFEECLESLSKQTCSNFRVYIGNDNSPNNPEKLIKKYSAFIDITYQKFEKNLGGVSLVSQWNRCLDLIKDEEWVMLLGDDDLLSPNCVDDFEGNKNEIEHNQIRVVRYATFKIDENGDKVSKVYTHPKLESSLQFFFKKLRGETRSSLSEYIFKKVDLQKKGFKDLPLAWHADDLAILEFSGFGEIFSINSSCVYFRNSGINITSMHNNLKQKNNATFLFFHYLLWKYPEFFDKEGEKILYSKLEKSFLNDKQNIEFFYKYLRLRFSSINLLGLVNFGKLYFISIWKSKKIKAFLATKK